MTTKKLKSYTLFSSLFLATVFATNTAFADDVVSNDQANQPTASQEQAAPATGDQTVLQDAQAGNNNAASNQHEAPVTDPTVREINKVDNGDGTSTTTSEVTSQDLSEQSDGVQQAWYRILEEDLPSEIADNELAEVESIRDKELLRKENQIIGKKVREASHNGDVDTAIEELERLIAQKRRME